MFLISGFQTVAAIRLLSTNFHLHMLYSELNKIYIPITISLK